MGLLDDLLGREGKRTNKFRGRNYEGPANMQSLTFQGPPFSQMPGNNYAPPMPPMGAAMPQPRQGARTTPWNPNTSGIRDESFYREGGPYYRAGVHRNPHTMQAQPQLSPPLPYNKIDAPQRRFGADQRPRTPQRMPDQHIAGAITREAELAEFQLMMEQMKREEMIRKLLRGARSGLLDAPQPQTYSPSPDAVQIPSASQGFAPPMMGGAY